MDQKLIERVAKDYFEGWFDGDVQRMDRSLHPNLVKRGAVDGTAQLGITTKERMLDLTAAAAGAEEAVDRTLDIRVLDIYGDIATAVVHSAPYHEYLHLVRTDDGWKIANALFQLS